MSTYTVAQLEVALQAMDRKVQDALADGTILEMIKQNSNNLVWPHVQNFEDIDLLFLLFIALQRRIFAMSKTSQSDIKKIFNRYSFVTKIVVSATQFKENPDWQVKSAEFLKEQRAARDAWEKRAARKTGKQSTQGQEVRQFN